MLAPCCWYGSVYCGGGGFDVGGVGEIVGAATVVTASDVDDVVFVVVAVAEMVGNVGTSATAAAVAVGDDTPELKGFFVATKRMFMSSLPIVAL